MDEELNHIPIHPRMIVEEMIRPFDVYFRPREQGEMVLYCVGGGKPSTEVQKKVHSLDINRFYIHRKDWNSFKLYAESILDKIIEDPAIGIQKKAEIVYKVISSIAQQMFQHPKRDLIARYRTSITRTARFIMMDPLALQNLITCTAFDFNAFNHSINVGIFSTGLAVELLRKNPEHNIEETAAGFFLHDIGKSRIPPEITSKRGLFTSSERIRMQAHVEDGVRLLDEYKFLTNEVEIVVSQHHERHNGSGYPHGLSGDDIHLYADICSIADVFDGLTGYRPYRKEYSAFDALRIMKNEVFKDFNPEYYKAFVRLFGKM